MKMYKLLRKNLEIFWKRLKKILQPRKALRYHPYSMESFEVLRKHLEMWGIILQQPNHSFNLINSSVVILIGSNIFAFLKLFDEATTFDEYTNTVYKGLYSFSFCIVYLNFVLKTPELFGFIGGVDDIIMNSE